MITEVKSEAGRDRYLATRTWRVIGDFETFYAQSPGAPRIPGHSLLLITAGDTRAVIGHGVTTMFQRKMPELRLRNGISGSWKSLWRDSRMMNWLAN
jgi:hypothetical protein